MASFTVQLVTRVPIFADLVVTADDEEAARAIVARMRADADEQLCAIQWRHGEGGEHKIAFALDERDISEVEVQHVEKIDERTVRIAAFHAQHGEAWGVIEQAGMERERHTGSLYASKREAWDHVRAHYDPDERDDLKVDVAHWDAEGGFWSYDH